MHSTVAICSKVKRIPMISKYGNKNYYKGTRQSVEPGGTKRTGQPGRHVVNGHARYQLMDESVRFYVAPPGFHDQSFKDHDWIKPYVFKEVPVSQVGARTTYASHVVHNNHHLQPIYPDTLPDEGKKTWKSESKRPTGFSEVLEIDMGRLSKQCPSAGIPFGAVDYQMLHQLSKLKPVELDDLTEPSPLLKAIQVDDSTSTTDAIFLENNRKYF